MMTLMTSDEMAVVDPRAEAQARVGGRFDARVLEPSPPAVTEAPWFADDPVNDPSAPGLPVLAPVPIAGAASTWDDVVRAEPELASWCANLWLAASRPLVLPGDLYALGDTRRSWHVLAEHVVAAARYRANGKIGLRFTRGGFGTPFFGADEQVRIDAAGVVVIRGDEATVHPITTAGAVAQAIGIEPGAPTEVYTPTTSLDPDAPLPVDRSSAQFIGDWFGFGASVLEELRARAAASDDPARVQLWPEHFDLSVDFGQEDASRRATYGASPGDDAHDAPYVYVSPWAEQHGDFWNEQTFASLSLTEFAAAADQRAAALDFFARARHALDHD
jgi:hypothetical protein